MIRLWRSGLCFCFLFAAAWDGLWGPSAKDLQRNHKSIFTSFLVMSAKRVGSYFVLMRQWGMVKLSRPKEIHHAPF
jgi:hypothetical protein